MHHNAGCHCRHIKLGLLETFSHTMLTKHREHNLAWIASHTKIRHGWNDKCASHDSYT